MGLRSVRRRSRRRSHPVDADRRPGDPDHRLPRRLHDVLGLGRLDLPGFQRPPHLHPDRPHRRQQLGPGHRRRTPRRLQLDRRRRRRLPPPRHRVGPVTPGPRAAAGRGPLHAAPPGGAVSCRHRTLPGVRHRPSDFGHHNVG
ncbi:MAG: hypothetical protein E6R06_11280 [Mycobacterium sp.]|nr:MAG: hypothetical protein E6R06_11280 [Mycobacterium sp.]